MPSWNDKCNSSSSLAAAVAVAAVQCQCYYLASSDLLDACSNVLASAADHSVAAVLQQLLSLLVSAHYANGLEPCVLGQVNAHA
eukprot:6292-Heterococcus_DN1.PRE.3